MTAKPQVYPTAMPIPTVLSHSVASDEPETKETLALFEAVVARLEPAVRREIAFDKSAPIEFPQIIVSYLFSSLQRVRVTSWGVISALNAPNEVLFVLAIRSMLESAANIAYLKANMQKTYAGDVSRKDMTYLSLRMKFATRKPDDMELDDDEA